MIATKAALRATAGMPNTPTRVAYETVAQLASQRSEAFTQSLC